MSLSRGFANLMVIPMVMGLTLGLILLVSYLYGTIGIKNALTIIIDANDQGGEITTFLRSGDEYTALESITSFKRTGFAEKMDRQLNTLGWSIRLTDQDGTLIQQFGGVRPAQFAYVDVPLPGGQRGKIGFDVQ